MIICCPRTPWWCIADAALRCRVRWVCDRHDQAITGDPLP